MANPQKEHGHTAIANEVLEALYKAPISSSEFRIVLFVLRKTWGWGKKEDALSFNLIAESTNMSRKVVTESVHKLVTKKLLLKSVNSYINRYSFNKDYEQWVVTERSLGSHRRVTRVVTEKLPKLVTGNTPTKEKKETNTKETIQKATANAVAEPKAITVSSLIDAFKHVNPNHEPFFKNKTQREAITRMMNKHGPEKMLAVILSLGETNVMEYAPIITTPLQLEKRLGDLVAFRAKYLNKKRLTPEEEQFFNQTNPLQ